MNGKKFLGDISCSEALQYWTNQRLNQSFNLLALPEEKKCMITLFEAVQFNRYILNGNVLYQKTNISPNLEAEECITFRTLTSWYLDYNQLLNSPSFIEDYPPVILVVHSNSTISGIRNTENGEFDEMILAPAKWRIVKKDINPNAIFYHIFSDREFLILKQKSENESQPRSEKFPTVNSHHLVQPTLNPESIRTNVPEESKIGWSYF